MARTRPPYPEPFRREAVELVHSSGRRNPRSRRISGLRSGVGLIVHAGGAPVIAVAMPFPADPSGRLCPLRGRRPGQKASVQAIPGELTEGHGFEPSGPRLPVQRFSRPSRSDACAVSQAGRTECDRHDGSDSPGRERCSDRAVGDHHHLAHNAPVIAWVDRQAATPIERRPREEPGSIHREPTQNLPLCLPTGCQERCDLTRALRSGRKPLEARDRTIHRRLDCGDGGAADARWNPQRRAEAEILTGVRAKRSEAVGATGPRHSQPEQQCYAGASESRRVRPPPDGPEPPPGPTLGAPDNSSRV